MSIAPIVYLFVCARARFVGLSLLKDGANLPPCPAPSRAWKRVAEMPLQSHELTLRNIDPKPAIEAVIARGYYVEQASADIVSFPGKRKSKERY